MPTRMRRIPAGGCGFKQRSCAVMACSGYGQGLRAGAPVVRVAEGQVSTVGERLFVAVYSPLSRD